MAEQFSVVAGNATGSRIGLADELIIGRSTPGLGNLGGDGEISRVHARVYRDQTGPLVIEDLGSTNGTYVNGVRIAGPHPLRHGDQVRVGKTTMSFESAAPATAPMAAAAPAPFTAPPAAATQQQPPAYGPPGTRRSWLPWSVLIGVVVLALTAAGLAIGGVFGGGGGGKKSASARATPARRPATAPTTTPPIAMPQPPPAPTTPAPDPNAFPPGTKRSFVNGCARGGASRALCACTFDKLMARLTFPQFSAVLGRANRRRLPPPVRRAVLDCVNSGVR